MRDDGGFGGGNGCSNGVPCGRCRLTAGWSGGATGADGGAEGAISEEEGGGIKKDGFTRFVARLLLLPASGALWRAIRGGVDREGICKIGTDGVTEFIGMGRGGTV